MRAFALGSGSGAFGGVKAVDPTQGRKDGCKLLPLKLVIEKRDGLAGTVVL